MIRQASSAETAAGQEREGAPGPHSRRMDPTIQLASKHVTQEQIDAYAEVSGDHNPIHIDPDAARAVGLDGTIAHGMLNMAFVGQC